MKVVLIILGIIALFYGILYLFSDTSKKKPSNGLWKKLMQRKDETDRSSSPSKDTAEYMTSEELEKADGHDDEKSPTKLPTDPPRQSEDPLSAKDLTDAPSWEISKKEENPDGSEPQSASAPGLPAVISTKRRTSGRHREGHAYGAFAAPSALRIKRGYFTREQAVKYADRSYSARLERALTQEMLLVNLFTDNAVIPHRAEATVYSLESGEQYQTSLTQCSCPDHQKTNAPCKHMLALALYVGAIELKK